MGQVGTGLSTWDRWDWDRGVFRLGGTGWDWDRGVFQLNQSTFPKVGLQDYKAVKYSTIPWSNLLVVRTDIDVVHGCFFFWVTAVEFPAQKC